MLYVCSLYIWQGFGQPLVKDSACKFFFYFTFANTAITGTAITLTRPTAPVKSIPTRTAHALETFAYVMIPLFGGFDHVLSVWIFKYLLSGGSDKSSHRCHFFDHLGDVIRTLIKHGTTLGNVLWNIGVARLGVNAGMMWQNTVPVFAVLISLVFFGVRPLFEQVLGGALVLGGVLYMQWNRMREQRARAG